MYTASLALTQRVEANMSLFLFSDDILRSQVFPFFDLTDLVSFDTAVTSKIHRPRWLRILKCVEQTSSSPISRESAIDWMKKKQLLVSGINVFKATPYIVYKLSHTFHDLQSIVIVSGGIDCLSMTSVGYGCPRLRSVTIVSHEFSNCTLSVLGEGCPQLESVKITSPLISDFGLISLARECHKLSVLEVNSDIDETPPPQNMFFTVQKYTDASLSALGDHCPLLKDFSLRSSGTLFTDAGLSKLSKCAGLRSLTLRPSSNISEISIAHLASHCPELRHVDMSNLTDNAIRSLVEKCEFLSKLRIPHSAISDDTLLLLASRCQRIELLDVSHCIGITDHSVKIIARLRNLRNLSLDHAAMISDVALQHLVTECPLLTSIGLRDCPSLTDAGFLCLAQWCAQLVSIDVAKNSNITNKAIIAIAQGCPHLKQLHIDDCENVSDVCMVAISHLCKQLELLDTIGCSTTVHSLSSFLWGCPKLKEIRISGPLWYDGDYEDPEIALTRERPDVILVAPY